MGCSAMQPIGDVITGTKDFLSNNSDSNIVVVVGSGRSQQDSVENALDIAVKKVAGVLIVSEKKLRNNELVKDITLSYSGGYVSGYEIVECETDEVVQRFDCKLRVKVNKMKIRNFLYAEGNVIEIQDEYAKYETQKKAVSDYQNMIRYYFTNIRTSYMRADIKNVNFRPYANNPSIVEVNVRFKVSLDKSYKKEFVNFLEKLQKDTGGSMQNYSFMIRYGFPFSAAEFMDNTVYLKDIGINLYNYNHQSFGVVINPFNECVSSKHFHEGILTFKSETYNYSFRINKSQLADADSISVQMSECHIPVGFSWE